MTYRHVQQLALIRKEYKAAYASLTYVERTWSNTNSEPELSDVFLLDVKSTLDHLETTYILRAFVTFEALLREHLEARKVSVPYRTEDLINSVVRRQRPRIPDDIRDQAHTVREYRNTIVHSNPISGPVLTFQVALSYLNQFLDRVEDIP